MKIVVPIPCNGRYPLLELTVRRLYEKNKVHKVILIGDDSEIERIANELNCEYVQHANSPLGAKWNAGFIACEKYNPDAVLFAGSSDWIEDNYLQEFDGKYDVVGMMGCHFYDNGKTLKRAVHWRGYQCNRKGETIGIGRILSKRILQKINWKPFDSTKDNSMDYYMWNNCKKAGATFRTVDQNSRVLMSISDDRWTNKHKFEDHLHGELLGELVEPEILIRLFPELLEL